MARQLGNGKTKGTVRGLSYYESKLDGSLIREKSGVDGSRIKTDKNFELTRQNMAEFGLAANAGKLIRAALLSLMARVADTRVTSRLHRIMTQVRLFDTTSARGERSPVLGIADPEAKNLLRGFNFNAAAPFTAIVRTDTLVDPLTGAVTIADLDPKLHLSIPEGATHAVFQSVWLKVDFAAGSTVKALSNEVVLAVNAPAGPLTLTPAAIPPGNGVSLFLVRVVFTQMVNGLQYQMADTSRNTLCILEVV